MRGVLALAKRNLLETVRAPLNLVFYIVLPLIMLVLMSLLLKNTQSAPPNFQIVNFASGICVFGYTFISLFVGMQIAGDKNSSFMKRINISPVSRVGYYFSYFISSLPIAAVQTALFFAVALMLGYPFGGRLLLNVLYLIPSAVFYIAVGILVGCLCGSEKQTSPISTIFISLTGIFGGIFMPTELFNGAFATIVEILPFSHSVAIGSEIYSRGASCVYPHILYLIGYTLLIVSVITVIELVRKYKK